jgi:hypothetical protein
MMKLGRGGENWIALFFCRSGKKQDRRYCKMTCGHMIIKAEEIKNYFYTFS